MRRWPKPTSKQMRRGGEKGVQGTAVTSTRTTGLGDGCWAGGSKHWGALRRPTRTMKAGTMMMMAGTTARITRTMAMRRAHNRRWRMACARADARHGLSSCRRPREPPRRRSHAGASSWYTHRQGRAVGRGAAASCYSSAPLQEPHFWRLRCGVRIGVGA